MSKRLAAAGAAAAATVAVLAVSPWASGSPRPAATKPAAVSGYAHTELGPVDFLPAPTIVATMPLPKGKYLVNAKLTLVVDAGPTDISCSLSAGPTVDVAVAERLRGDGQGSMTVPLAGPAVLGAAGRLTIACANTGGTAQAKDIVITAVRVTSLRATASG